MHSIDIDDTVIGDKLNELVTIQIKSVREKRKKQKMMIRIIITWNTIITINNKNEKFKV
jgi:hypothetical protein